MPVQVGRNVQDRNRNQHFRYATPHPHLVAQASGLAHKRSHLATQIRTAGGVDRLAPGDLGTNRLGGSHAPSTSTAQRAAYRSMISATLASATDNIDTDPQPLEIAHRLDARPVERAASWHSNPAES